MVTGRPTPTNRLPGTRVGIHHRSWGSCPFRSDPTPSRTKGGPTVHTLPPPCNGPSLRPEDAHNRLPWKDRCPQSPWKQAGCRVNKAFQSPRSMVKMGRDLSLTPELRRTRAGPTKAWDPVDQYKGRTVDKWQRMQTRPRALNAGTATL